MNVAMNVLMFGMVVLGNVFFFFSLAPVMFILDPITPLSGTLVGPKTTRPTTPSMTGFVATQPPLLPSHQTV